MTSHTPEIPKHAAPQVDNSGMIEYLTTEISTLSTNIMTFRSRITFSIFVGPFLILGSLIVLSAKEALTFGLNSQWEWKTALAGFVSLVGFLFFGFLSGRIEQGALNQCNQWRKCIIMLQRGQQLSDEDLEKQILDRQSWNATWVYIFAYVAIVGTFISSIFLVLKLVHRAG